MKFEVGKIYRTRGGRNVRVLANDCPGTFPIVAVTTHLVGDSNYVRAYTCTLQGRELLTMETPDDLLPPLREWTLETDDGERIRVREVVGE